MNNNDVLRRLRYALELDNLTLLATFREGGLTVQPEELAAALKREDEPGFVPIDDDALACFMDGFVTFRRGRRDDAAAPQRRPPLSNNRILRALRIGLELRDTDLLTIMELADAPVSKTEFGALFRREDHRNYQPCGDQFLRSFIKGLGIWHRKRTT